MGYEWQLNEILQVVHLAETTALESAIIALIVIKVCHSNLNAKALASLAKGKSAEALPLGTFFPVPVPVVFHLGPPWQSYTWTFCKGDCSAD